MLRCIEQVALRAFTLLSLNAADVAFNIQSVLQSTSLGALSCYQVLAVLSAFAFRSTPWLISKAPKTKAGMSCQLFHNNNTAVAFPDNCAGLLERQSAGDVFVEVEYPSIVARQAAFNLFEHSDE